tara:strand:+ start:455 stop:640 length:186 start_codon:yes stop_codon:yes gene_type:complete
VTAGKKVGSSGLIWVTVALFGPEYLTVAYPSPRYNGSAMLTIVSMSLGNGWGAFSLICTGV